jgi:glucosamine--fructose-6-phosphate aminotransferase (isomerizing)
LENYQKINRCKNCILPESFPSIYFVDGICSFCIDFETKKIQKLNGKRELKRQLSSESESKYDCLVPLSGGKDSSFILLYLVNELKLNPLAILVDTGYQTDLAIKNVKNICGILKTDLIIVIPTNYRRLAISEALKASVHLRKFWTVGICSYCETILRSTVVKEAYKRSIRKIVWGSTDFEDSVDYYHKGWNSDTFKSKYGRRKSAKEVVMKFLKFGRSFAVAPLSLVHILKFWFYTILMNFDMEKNSFLDKFNPFSGFSFNQKDVNVIYFFDFIRYDPIRQIEILKKNLNWHSPTNKEIRFDCGLSCFVNYAFMKKTGISKNGFILSTLIRNGLITRQKALEKEMNVENDLRNISCKIFYKLQKDQKWVFD